MSLTIPYLNLSGPNVRVLSKRLIAAFVTVLVCTYTDITYLRVLRAALTISLSMVFILAMCVPKPYGEIVNPPLNAVGDDDRDSVCIIISRRRICLP